MTITFITYSLLSFRKKIFDFIQNDELKTGITKIQTNPSPLAPGLVNKKIMSKFAID